MKFSLPHAAAAAAAVLLAGVSSVHAANPTLLYSFETLDTANRADGFGANGGGITVSQDTIGATNGTKSLKASVVAGATFVGIQTQPTTAGGMVTLPDALNDPATTALSLDVTVAPGQEFTGVFSDIGITEFGTANDGSGALQSQINLSYQHAVALPDGTYRISIPLIAAFDPETFDTGPNNTGILFSSIFGADKEVTPTSFEFYLNKSNDAPLVVYLDNVQAVSDSVWGLQGGGDISTASNFFGTVPNGVDATIDFYNNIIANAAINVGSAITVGTMRFNAAKNYTLSGSGSITLQTSTGSALVEVDASTQTINVPLIVASNTTFNTQNGGAQLAISAPLTVSAGKNVVQTGPGTVNYTSTIALQTGSSITFGNTTAPLALSLTSGSVATIAPHGTGNKLLLQVGTLSFAGTNNNWQGTVNIADNDLIIHGGDTIAQVANQIKMGFNAGSGYWNGSAGITSSAAHSDTRFLTAIGYAPGGSPFDGAATTPTDILVKYTFYGDADLNGTVDGADYQQIDNGFGMHLTGWSNGDFNYDGVVNGSDFALIDNTFNQILATNASALAITGLPADLGSSDASTDAVPEPATFGLLAISALGLCNRRRRRFSSV